MSSKKSVENSRERGRDSRLRSERPTDGRSRETSRTSASSSSAERGRSSHHANADSEARQSTTSDSIQDNEPRPEKPSKRFDDQQRATSAGPSSRASKSTTSADKARGRQSRGDDVGSATASVQDLALARGGSGARNADGDNHAGNSSESSRERLMDQGVTSGPSGASASQSIETSKLAVSSALIEEYLRFANNNALDHRTDPGWRHPPWPRSLRPIAEWARSRMATDPAHYGGWATEQFQSWEDKNPDLVWMHQLTFMNDALIGNIYREAGLPVPPPTMLPHPGSIRVIELLGKANSRLDRTPASEEAIDQLVEKTVCDSDGEVECPICLEVVPSGEPITVLPCNRNHLFHMGCIALFLDVDNRCFQCGQTVPEPPAESIT